MNNKLLEVIIKLSKKDKKNLSQKALKLTEEVGELAKVVLPKKERKHIDLFMGMKVLGYFIK